MNKHFADYDPDRSYMDHIIEQLDLDRRYALRFALYAIESGWGPASSIAWGCRVAAGARWSRHYTAEHEGDSERDAEMIALGSFWYAMEKMVIEVATAHKARLTTASTVTAAPVDSVAPNVDAGAAAGEPNR